MKLKFGSQRHKDRTSSFTCRILARLEVTWRSRGRIAEITTCRWGRNSRIFAAQDNIPRAISSDLSASMLFVPTAETPTLIESGMEKWVMRHITFCMRSPEHEQLTILRSFVRGSHTLGYRESPAEMESPKITVSACFIIVFLTWLLCSVYHPLFFLSAGFRQAISVREFKMRSIEGVFVIVFYDS